MKHFHLFVLLLMPVILPVFFSCSKRHDTEPNPVPATSITGNWKWIRSQGGWGSIDSPGDDSVLVLKLTADSTYLLLLNDQVKFSGNYTMEGAGTDASPSILHFDNNLSMNGLRLFNRESILYCKHDTLQLYDYPVVDGASHLFRSR